MHDTIELSQATVRASGTASGRTAPLEVVGWSIVLWGTAAAS